MIVLQTITIPENINLTALITLTVEWICQKCKGPRGNHSLVNGISLWANPCGHLDFYHEVAKETKYEAIEIPEFIVGNATGKILYITVPWICAVCSGPRGKITRTPKCYSWSTFCGCMETFEQVAKQAVNQDLDIQLKSEVIIPKTNSVVIVNDHICIYCGNDRCNKQEKSCWRCGELI